MQFPGEATIQIRQNSQPIYRISNSAQKFMFWLLKWGMIGSAIVTGLHWSTKHFNNLLKH